MRILSLCRSLYIKCSKIRRKENILLDYSAHLAALIGSILMTSCGLTMMVAVWYSQLLKTHHHFINAFINLCTSDNLGQRTPSYAVGLRFLCLFIAGILVGYRLVNCRSRKSTILASSAVFLIGWAIICCVGCRLIHSQGLLELGILVTIFSSGMTCISIPMYLVEILDTHLRQLIPMYLMLIISAGWKLGWLVVMKKKKIIIALSPVDGLENVFVDSPEQIWCTASLCGIALSVLSSLGFWYIPHSPEWLYSTGYSDYTVKKCLTQLRPRLYNVESEFTDLKNSCDLTTHTLVSSLQKRNTVILLLASALSVLAGVDTVPFYAEAYYKDCCGPVMYDMACVFLAVSLCSFLLNGLFTRKTFLTVNGAVSCFVCISLLLYHHFELDRLNIHRTSTLLLYVHLAGTVLGGGQINMLVAIITETPYVCRASITCILLCSVAILCFIVTHLPLMFSNLAIIFYIHSIFSITYMIFSIYFL